MDFLHFAATLVKDLLIFAAVMFAIFAALLVVVSLLPAHNPLRQILSALNLRIAAMLGASLLAVPIEPIPLLDAAYDIAAPAGLIWFWITFFRKAAQILSDQRGARLPPR